MDEVASTWDSEGAIFKGELGLEQLILRWKGINSSPAQRSAKVCPVVTPSSRGSIALSDAEGKGSV